MSSTKDLKYSFQKKRDRAKKDFEDRRNEIYTALPRYKRIEDEIRHLGLNIAKAVLLDPDKSGEVLDQISKKMKLLKQEQAILLTENNVPLDYMTIHYECNDCQDNGFLADGKKCHCYTQELIKQHYQHSNLTDVLDKENFNSFDINIFSDKYNEELKDTPRKHMMTVLAECESFVYDFKKRDNHNLIFSGSTGLGKTFLCNCIAKALLDKGVTVLYQTAFRIIDTVSTYRFSNKKTSDMKFHYDLLIKCDLLIIDDLGTEMMNSFTNTEFFNIINTRLLENKKTIISTNFTLEQLEGNYSNRISSRIFGYYKFIEFIGEDLRWEI